MTHLEAVGVLVVFVVIAVLALWLCLSRLWGLRRVPRRLSWPEMMQLVWVPSPDALPTLTRRGRQRLMEAAYPPIETLLTDWEEDWELMPTDPTRGDDPWPNVPPVSEPPFDHSPVRPWAHG